MTDEEFGAHDERLQSLTDTQQAKLSQLMESANWLCDGGWITWRQCTEAEAAMLELVCEEKA